MLFYIWNLTVWFENTHNLLSNLLVKDKTKRFFLLKVVKCKPSLFTAKQNHLRESISNKGDFVILLCRIETVILLTTFLFLLFILLFVWIDMDNICLA